MANEIKYQDQVFPEGHPVEGEMMSANGTYTGEHKGLPMQDYADDAGQNEDPYWVEHYGTVRFGTIMQDATEGSMPEPFMGELTQTLTKCESSVDAESIYYCVPFKATFTPEDGYELPDTITVVVGADTLTADDDYTWAEGELSIPGGKIVGDVAITVTATEISG